MKEEFFNAILESIYGAVAIDMDGRITYINNQCASMFHVQREKVIGLNIKEVFPGTKMIDGLKYDEPRIVFYNDEFGFAVSSQTPIYLNGKKIGLFETDAIQNNTIIFDIYKEYSNFLNEEFGNNTDDHKNKNKELFLNALVGNSLTIMELKEKIIMAAKTNSTVVITGETGTGKEMVANAIHHLSNRSKQRLVKLNAAALPPNLVESELFGYEKGSFTGALKEGKKGKFEQADRGTLFIDEINQMPLSVQPKLLRALEEKEIDRIGGTKSIPVDVRIIAATNEDLKKLVHEKKFREDLYYRINVFEVKIPPLRKRVEDLNELITHMIEEFNQSMGKNVKGIDSFALTMLKKYSWPGNIRELRNKVEQAMHYCKDDYLKAKDFHFDNPVELEIPKTIAASANGNRIEAIKRNAERELIIKTLKTFNNNKTKAAEYLGIARTQLYSKMKRLDIKDDDF